jgi:hypothetical protein
MEERILKTIFLLCPRCLRVTLHHIYASKAECSLCHREYVLPDGRRNGRV